MDKVRGVIMIALGGVALYQGWTIHTGQRAILAYGVAVLALGVGIWRLTRKPPQPLA
jgi:hypothetical protein